MPKPMPLIRLAILFALPLALAAAPAQPMLPAAPDFRTLTREQADTAANGYVESLSRQVMQLTQQIQDKSATPEQKVYAIYLLGELHADYAKWLLVDNIDFPAPFTDPKTRVARWGPYPAVDALAKMGMPAFNECLWRIPKEDDPKRIQLLCQVLTQIQGTKYARMSIEDGIKELQQSAEPDLDKRTARFKTALTHFP